MAEGNRAVQILWGTIESPTSFQRLAETYLSDARLGDEGYWEVPITDFIEICPKISGAYWRLPNRPVRQGWVILSPSSSENSQQRLSRLLKERIRTQLIEDCRKRMEMMDEAFVGRMAEEVGRIVGLLKHQASAEVSFATAKKIGHPVCEKSRPARSVVNINHVGRVFLASISGVIGLTVDEAQAFFVNAPDYSAKTTRYQLPRLRKRVPPTGCPKLQINACCPVSRGDVKSDLCNREWMDHPLKYLRARQRSKHREEQQSVMQTNQD